VNALPSYAEMFRATYAFEQQHRTFGRCNMIRLPRREPGTFTESPVAGVSLQISRSPRQTIARVDLGAGRFDTPLQRPTFVVGPASVPCTYEIPQPLDMLFVELPRSVFAQHPCADDLGRLHTRPFDDTAVIGLAERMWQLAGALTALETDAAVATLAALLVHADAARTRPPAHGGLASWQARRTTEFLASHLHEDVSLNQLAVVAGLSTFHFARQFKQSTGLPPHAYLRRLRCERAKELLAGTGLSVGEIAADVGYETPQAFARMFRAEVGTSPSTYRRERRS